MVYPQGRVSHVDANSDPTAVGINIDTYGILADMRAYSIDLRQRLLATVDKGMAREEAAATFGVSLVTIKRLIALGREGGDLSPKLPSGRRRIITAEQEGALRAQMEANHDATNKTHARLWQERQGVAVSQWTLGRAIRRLGWTRKKDARGQ